MKRTIAGRRAASVAALVMRSRTVWLRNALASLPDGDDADLVLVDEIEAERRPGPADIDLAGHHLGQRRRRAAGRDRLRFEVVLAHEGVDDRMGRRAVGRIGDGLAVDIRERADRRGRLHVPEEVAAARHLGADDAQRRALRIGAEHAEHAGGRAELDAAGDHRLLGLAAALGIEDVEHDAVLLEDAAALAELGDRGIPQPALADRDAQRVVGAHRRGERKRGQQHAKHSIRIAALLPCRVGKAKRAHRLAFGRTRPR